ARAAPRAIRAPGARRTGRCAVAAPLPEAGWRAAARGAVPAPRLEASADRDRARPAQGGRASRARALEGATSRGGGPPRARGRPGRLDARAVVDLDARAGEPPARAGGPAARSGAPGSRREHLGQLVGRGDLELVVAAVTRPLVGPPPHEGGRVAKAVALQMVVLDLAHALDAQRLPREVLARAPAAVAARHPLALAACRLGPFAPGVVLERPLAERGQLPRELAAHRHRERRRD